MAIEKIRLMYENFWDIIYGEILFSTEAADYIAEYTQNVWRARCWRSTALTNQWLKRELYPSTEYGVTSFILDNHNFQDTATVRIQANATDVWTAPSINQLLTWDAGKMMYFWDTPQYYRWWRLKITDSGNPDGYLKVGRCFLGGDFTPSRNFERSYTKIWVDPSVIRFSDSRNISARERTKFRRFAYSFERITAADMSGFGTIWNLVGKFKPYFICQDSGDKFNKTYYVRNLNDWEIVHVLMDAQYDLTIEVEEAR